MKKAFLLGLAVAATALLTGCGSSSSDDNNNGVIKTDQTLDSYCLNYPNDSACGGTQYCDNSSSFSFSNSNSTCYPTDSNGYYHESQFGFSNGACGCPSGYVAFRGQSGALECMRRTTVTQTDWLLTVSFSKGNSRRNRNGRVRRNSHRDVSTEFVLNHGGQTIDQIVPAHGNCYQNLPIGCSLSDPYRSCAHLNQAGAPAVCVATNGGHNGQGLCVNQSIPTR